MCDGLGSHGSAVKLMRRRQRQDQVPIFAIVGEVPMKFYIVPGFQTDLSRRVIKERAI